MSSPIPLKILDRKAAVTPASGGCCGSSGESPQAPGVSACPQPWVLGHVTTPAGDAPKISTSLTREDRWQHLRCRISAFRENYTVPPGLYAAGDPDPSADVLVSANYKLSFDILRQELHGLNAWVLVLDTKGINVWCAAGKGTFGTEELVRRIAAVRLSEVVSHRRLIVPQLGAVGVSGHKVRAATGFQVTFGPVQARDVKAFITAGYKATKEMRTIGFPLLDRLVLTPMELNPAMKKYYPLFALAMLVVFGLQPGGILFRDAWQGSLPFLLLGFLAIVAGAVLTPVLLPFLPFRSFALKGWLVGLVSLVAALQFPLLRQTSLLLFIVSCLFFPLASSYVALQFTGSTTFTGMSGVKKELRLGLPLYLSASAVSAALLVVYKLGQWGVL